MNVLERGGHVGLLCGFYDNGADERLSPAAKHGNTETCGWRLSRPLAGTLSETQLTVVISFPAGAFTSIGPTLTTCEMTADGTLAASATTLSGNTVQMWTDAGVLTSGGRRNGQVSLSK
jgi:hypothetical protein